MHLKPVADSGCDSTWYSSVACEPKRGLWPSSGMLWSAMLLSKDCAAGSESFVNEAASSPNDSNDSIESAEFWELSCPGNDIRCGAGESPMTVAVLSASNDSSLCGVA